jgi:hypothetical protein
MATGRTRELDPGYTSEIDTVDEKTWCQILQEFDDANIYQTWSYASVARGGRNLSHLILKKQGTLAAVAQARIAKVPFLNIGIAYIRWAPLWRRCGTEPNIDIFRQALRALRNEFVCKRRLVLRLFPNLFDDDSPCFSAILAEEGFSSTKEPRARTILMDLRPPLEDLRGGMKRNWRRNLKVAEESGLEVLEGSGEGLLETFIGIYKETLSRKKFLGPNEVNQLKLIQVRLPESLKMKIMLCRSGDDVCAGLVWSEIGTMGVELFAATTNAALENRASYLLRWKLIEKLRQNHFAVYNLNGINPITNPGVYKFKSELVGNHGKDIYFLGRFDSHCRPLSYLCVECADRLGTAYRALRARNKTAGGVKLQPEGTPLAMSEAKNVDGILGC